MSDQKRDRWDKADIILKPVGGLLTALAVAALAFFGSRTLDRRQAEDSKVRLYTELMSQRETSETVFRKEMFNSVFGPSLTSASGGYESQILNLELLSYNFNEALDLSPLFKQLYGQIKESKSPLVAQYLGRLEQAAAEVKAGQIAALEEAGGKLDASIDLDELEKHLDGIPVIDGTIKSFAGVEDESEKARFKLTALFVDKGKKEVRVHLQVIPLKNGGRNPAVEEAVSSSVFTISPFDFPMIANTRLPHGRRCAVVVRSFGDQNIAITLVYFPENWQAVRVVEMARLMSNQP